MEGAAAAEEERAAGGGGGGGGGLSVLFASAASSVLLSSGREAEDETGLAASRKVEPEAPRTGRGGGEVACESGWRDFGWWRSNGAGVGGSSIRRALQKRNASFACSSSLLRVLADAELHLHLPAPAVAGRDGVARRGRARLGSSRVDSNSDSGKTKKAVNFRSREVRVLAFVFVSSAR